MNGGVETTVRASVVLYDVARTSYVEWRELLTSIVIVILGALVVLREERRYRFGGIFLITIGLSFLVLGTGASAIQHRDLVMRLRSGKYENVEGAITDFSPGSFDGHVQESFTVAGHTFSSAKSMAGYHDVQGAGGPLGDGVRVRIADVNGMIARFELLD